MRLFSALLLALLASTFLTCALVIYLPFNKADLLIWLGMAFFLLWPLLIFYCYWPESNLKPAITLASLTIISAMATFLSWMGS